MQDLLSRKTTGYANSCHVTYPDASYYEGNGFNHEQNYYAYQNQNYDTTNYQNFEPNYNQQDCYENQYYNYDAEFYQNNSMSQNYNCYNEAENSQGFYQYPENANQN